MCIRDRLGTFHKAAAQLCGNSYATQYVDRFETCLLYTSRCV